MKCAEAPIALRFQTPAGDVKLTGEHLDSNLEAIDYLTGRDIPLSGIVALPPTAIYNLTFSDGRRGLYRSDGEIYLGGQVVPMNEVIRLIAELNPRGNGDFYRHLADGEKVVILSENPGLKLDLNGIVEYEGSEYHVKPDPYSAGCLLPVGDFGRDYVNLPSDRTDTLDTLTVSNGWEATSGDTVDTVGFKRRGSSGDQLVNWRDFLHGADRADLTNPAGSELVRSCYLVTPVTDRLEFLRGFFDTNYVDLSTEGGLKPVEREIEVSLPFYERIKFIRDVMFSLGIGSMMTSLRAGRIKSQYGLQPKVTLREFSQLFNKVEKAERLLAASEVEQPPRSKDVYLRSIELTTPSAASYNVVPQDHRKKIYLGTNFLPRISYAG